MEQAERKLKIKKQKGKGEGMRILGFVLFVFGVFMVGWGVSMLFVLVPLWAVGLAFLSAGLKIFVGIIAMIGGIAIFGWRSSGEKIPLAVLAMVAAIMFSTAAWAAEPSVSQRLEITKVVRVYWGNAVDLSFDSGRRIVVIDDEGVAFAIFTVQQEAVVPRVIFCDLSRDAKQIASKIFFILGEEE